MKTMIGFCFLLFSTVGPVFGGVNSSSQIPFLSSFSIESTDKHIPGITQTRFGVFEKSETYTTEEEDFQKAKDWKKNVNAYSKNFEETLKNKKLEFSKILNNDQMGFSRNWVLRMIKALQKRNIQVNSPLDLMIWNCDTEAEVTSYRSKIVQLRSSEVKFVTRYSFLRKCTLDFSELVYQALDPILVMKNTKKVQSGKSDFCKFEALRIWEEYSESIPAVGYRTTHQHQYPFDPPSTCTVWGTYFRALTPGVDPEQIWSKELE